MTANDLGTVWESLADAARNAYLSTLIPLKEDRSGSPRALAQRSALRSLFPISVTCYEVEGFAVARLTTSPAAFLFLRGAIDDEAKAAIVRLRDEKLMTEEETDAHVIWMALDNSGIPLWPLYFVLERAFAIAVDNALEQRASLIARSFETIGWHDSKVTEPEGSPDLRIKLVGRSPRSKLLEIHPLSPADLALEASLAGRTLVVVPDEAEAVARISRILYVSGWHYWELFTLAKREAIMALEASLQILARETHSSTGTFQSMINGIGSDASGQRLLSAWERDECHRLRRSRNSLVHMTTGPTIEWIANTRADISSALHLVNLMWARHRAGVPREVSWDNAP